MILALISLRVATPNDLVKSLVQDCMTAFKMGFGALIGLIGGKVS